MIGCETGMIAKKTHCYYVLRGFTCSIPEFQLPYRSCSCSRSNSGSGRDTLTLSLLRNGISPAFTMSRKEIDICKKTRNKNKKYISRKINGVDSNLFVILKNKNRFNPLFNTT